LQQVFISVLNLALQYFLAAFYQYSTLTDGDHFSHQWALFNLFTYFWCVIINILLVNVWKNIIFLTLPEFRLPQYT